MAGRMNIETGDWIKTLNPFYAGVVVGEAVHKLGTVWIVDDGSGKRSMIFKDEAVLWCKGDSA